MRDETGGGGGQRVRVMFFYFFYSIYSFFSFFLFFAVCSTTPGGAGRDITGPTQAAMETQDAARRGATGEGEGG